MKDFSIFEQALKFSDPKPANLGLISNLSRRQFERESFRFRGTSPCLEYGSLMIENELLLRTNRSGRIYAGFENLSCLRPIIDRYLRIADVSESVSVFGVPDWTPPRHPNIRFINLAPDFRLAREWFLIADSSTLRIALVAFDEEGFTSKSPDMRNFTAVKTSNLATVARLARATESVIDWSVAV